MKKKGVLLTLAMMLVLTGCGSSGQVQEAATEIPAVSEETSAAKTESEEVTMQQLFDANVSEYLAAQYGGFKAKTVFNPGTEYETEDEISVSANAQGLVVVHEIFDSITYYAQDGEMFFHTLLPEEKDGMYVFMLSEYEQYMRASYGYILVLPVDEEIITSQKKREDGTIELTTELQAEDMLPEEKDRYGIEEGKLVSRYIVSAETLAVEMVEVEIVTADETYVFCKTTVAYGADTLTPSKWAQLKEIKDQAQNNREITYIIDPNTAEEKTMKVVMPGDWYSGSDVWGVYKYFNDAEGTDPFETSDTGDKVVYVIKTEE